MIPRSAVQLPEARGPGTEYQFSTMRGRSYTDMHRGAIWARANVPEKAELCHLLRAQAPQQLSSRTFGDNGSVLCLPCPTE